MPSQLVDEKFAKKILDDGYELCKLIGERVIRIQLAKCSETEDEDESDQENGGDTTSIEDEEEEEAPSSAATTNNDEDSEPDVFAVYFEEELKKAKYQEQQNKKIKPKKKKSKEEQVKLLRTAMYTGLEKWRNQNTTKLVDFYRKSTKGDKKKGSRSATMDIIHGTVKNLVQEDQYPAEIRELLGNLILLPVSNSRVERIFSHLKLLFSKRRYNLKPQMVKELMFLGYNKLIPKSKVTDFL
jgi:hypothetical protein